MDIKQFLKVQKGKQSGAIQYLETVHKLSVRYLNYTQALNSDHISNVLQGC